MPGFVLTQTAVHVSVIVLFIVTQAIYSFCMLVVAYFYTRPTDLVTLDGFEPERSGYPRILLLYPVLHELEETMRTTFTAIDIVDYPRERARVVAIPNLDDHETIAALRRLESEFAWLEILTVPATPNASWTPVWSAWSANDKAYWWHLGRRAGVRDLPPKKTRQLIYAFYTLCPPGSDDVLVSYIDADSAPPPNYFMLGAAGAVNYDVVQLTNVAGNLLASWAASFHAYDHMCWDGSIYPHMTAHGKHPFYVLGKGLFYKASDLHVVGGFNPWLTIEDPEVGMRLWANGRRLGVVRQPLVEEVPSTFGNGVTQRKRWVCGFFQSLGAPLRHMGMSFGQRLRARLNLVPNLSLLYNPIGLGVGIWILVLAISGHLRADLPLVVLAACNLGGLATILVVHSVRAWQLSGIVLEERRSRLHYLFRVNPLFVMCYWLFWTVSMVIGIEMFVHDKGLVWERTEKIDANHDLVRLLETSTSESGEHLVTGDAPTDAQPADERAHFGDEGAPLGGEGALAPALGLGEDHSLPKAPRPEEARLRLWRDESGEVGGGTVGRGTGTGVGTASADSG